MALDEKNVYALDSGKNSWLTMTKEQILAAITQAVSTGEIKDIDAGFITKLQEMNKQGVLQLWVGTMAEFEALEEKSENMLYLFTDDPTVTDIESELKNLETQIKNIVDGNTVVKKAEAAKAAETAEKVKNIGLYKHVFAFTGQDDIGSTEITAVVENIDKISGQYTLDFLKENFEGHTFSATGYVKSVAEKTYYPIYAITVNAEYIGFASFDKGSSMIPYEKNKLTITDQVVQL